MIPWIVGIVERSISVVVLALVVILLSISCDRIDDERIPNYPVYIPLSDSGSWNVYGVSGFGSHKRFILSPALRMPSGFPYTQQSATGFGGVLLIGGMDPFSGTTEIPLAYDLSCPVEAKSDVRVEVEGESYHAVCPVCGSVYDVTMGAGAPISGPSTDHTRKYGLRRYKCNATLNGGFIITN